MMNNQHSGRTIERSQDDKETVVQSGLSFWLFLSKLETFEGYLLEFPQTYPHVNCAPWSHHSQLHRAQKNHPAKLFRTPNHDQIMTIVK